MNDVSDSEIGLNHNQIKHHENKQCPWGDDWIVQNTHENGGMSPLHPAIVSEKINLKGKQIRA